MVPTLLDSLERYCLIQGREAHERVHHGAEHRGLAELHSENRCHQVEVSYAHQAPVQPANYRVVPLPLRPEFSLMFSPFLMKFSYTALIRGGQHDRIDHMDYAV